MTIGDVGILAATVAFGHRMDRRPVLGRQAHDLAKDLARQVSADIVNELDVGPGLVGVVEDPANDLANPAVEFGDDPRLELRRDRLAVRRVAWRIHRQEHVAHGLERDWVEVLDDDTALGRTEDLAVLGDMNDVGMAEHGPVAGFVVHLDPRHRLGRPKGVEARMRGPVDVGVGISDESGHVAQPTERRSTTKTSVSLGPITPPAPNWP